MVLARPGSEVIKIDCCTHPRILGAKRLLQHNLFNGGSPGRMCVAGGWRVDCHRRGMIERRHVTSPGTLMWDCEEGTCGTREPNCKTIGFFKAFTVQPRAEFNQWWSSGYLDMRSYWLDIMPARRGVVVADEFWSPYKCNASLPALLSPALHHQSVISADGHTAPVKREPSSIFSLSFNTFACHIYLFPQDGRCCPWPALF